MRVEIRDGMGQMHSIRTINPDILAAWFVERLNVIRPDHVMPAQVLIWPDWISGPETPYPGQPDWLPDSRILGVPGKVLRPLDLVRYMQEQIERIEELNAREEPERI